MRTAVVLVTATMLAAFAPIHAQEARRSGPDTNPYVVEYRLRDGGDSAAATDRRYTLMVNGEHKGVLKVGNRTPAVSGSFEPINANSLVNTQYTYLDVGLNIESTIRELDARVELHTSLDLSALAEKSAPATGTVHNPTINQTKLDVSTTLQLGKPTVLASITDPVTQRLLQVVVTVTPAN
jgi:hypothetical protein